MNNNSDKSMNKKYQHCASIIQNRYKEYRMFENIDLFRYSLHCSQSLQLYFFPITSYFRMTKRELYMICVSF